MHGLPIGDKKGTSNWSQVQDQNLAEGLIPIKAWTVVQDNKIKVMNNWTLQIWVNKVDLGGGKHL